MNQAAGAHPQSREDGDLETYSQRRNQIESPRSPQLGSCEERSDDTEPASTASREACQHGDKKINPLRAGIKLKSAKNSLPRLRVQSLNQACINLTRRSEAMIGLEGADGRAGAGAGNPVRGARFIAETI